MCCFPVGRNCPEGVLKNLRQASKCGERNKCMEGDREVQSERVCLCRRNAGIFFFWKEWGIRVEWLPTHRPPIARLYITLWGKARYLSRSVSVTFSPPFSLILNGYAHSFCAYPHTWATLLESSNGVHLDCAFWICLFWCMLVLHKLCEEGVLIYSSVVFSSVCVIVWYMCLICTVPAYWQLRQLLQQLNTRYANSTQ